MRATLMYGAGDVRVENVPDSVIKRPTDALVRITGSCICGSDLWPYASRSPDDEPARMGHEFIGMVEDTGPEVTTVARGDLVVSPFAISDGTCEFCRAGLQTACTAPQAGYWDEQPLEGAQAEAIRVPLADGTLVKPPVAARHLIRCRHRHANRGQRFRAGGDWMAGMTSVLPLSAIEPMPGLASRLGVPAQDLLVLREDLIGVAGGGNKVRKAVAALGRAATDGVGHVVTTGAPQSNHARAVALVGAWLGLRVTLVLEGGQPPLRAGNLLLEELAGALVVWAGGEDSAVVADRVAGEASETVRVIAFGGSDAAAVDVYAVVGQDLMRQVPDLRHVVVAAGSGGTAAGLVAALGPGRVLAVDTGAVPDVRATIAGLVREARPAARLDAGSLRIDSGQVGDGYASIPPPVLEAARNAPADDGIVFDVTYAGRALAALAVAVRTGAVRSGERTVLIHTGGIPGLFGHPGLLRSPH
jgi:D-cysteine desulfhydrase